MSYNYFVQIIRNLDSKTSNPASEVCSLYQSIGNNHKSKRKRTHSTLVGVWIIHPQEPRVEKAAPNIRNQTKRIQEQNPRKQTKTKKQKPWFNSRLHMGRTCVKGPSFCRSANSSVKYWLQEMKIKKRSQPTHNSRIKNQTLKSSTQIQQQKTKKNPTQKKKTQKYLSICGETALAGEKFTFWW